MAAPAAVLLSEWTKIRTVRSTIVTLAAAFVVTVGLSAVICAVINSNFTEATRDATTPFDAASTSFAGMFLGQLAVIVFGVLVVGNEYSTGMIRASLAAVPRRGQLLTGKASVVLALVLVVALLTSFVSFLLGQALLGSHGTTLGAPHVLRVVIGAALYMTLICLFSVGVAAMLRNQTLSLGVLMPFFFLVSPILSSVPKVKTVARYFPDRAGSEVTSVYLAPGSPYGPWTGLGICALWAAAALLGGWLMLSRRDA
ncbi:ABC transporter permease subunit [Peterkaempfera bronchialis]|uniref:ABC transporter permease n=1 Tax=Peterkaempfera bronchialis TaxID=2126346 RepID=A0A345T0I8_9ACTN|nr:ABC transporter permease subunit [Peterkaempfera bronchialis]AXI79493.1 ABC transporter permease [Peterkaempfera bronchialis]